MSATRERVTILMWLVVLSLVAQPDYCWPGWYECLQEHIQCTEPISEHWESVVHQTLEEHKRMSEPIYESCNQARELCELQATGPLSAIVGCLSGPIADGATCSDDWTWETWYSDGEVFRKETGYGVRPTCWAFDWDNDQDVDLRDFGEWQNG